MKENFTDALNRNIKDVIKDFPAVADILMRHQIACSTCAVGTCAVKDIVSIHNLPPNEVEQLFKDMAAIMFPGQVVTIPKIARPAQQSATKKMSPPLQELVTEHTWIKRVIAMIPALTRDLATHLPERAEALAQLVDFVRGFADRFHHAKEEDILFAYAGESTEVVAVMRQEHEIGRAHIRAAVAGLEARQTAPVQSNLTAYGQLLTDHIRKEDEVLYPWIDRQLTDAQVGRLYSQFQEVNQTFGERPARYREWVETMEKVNKQ